MTIAALANHSSFYCPGSGQQDRHVVARKPGHTAELVKFTRILGWDRFLFRSRKRTLLGRSTYRLLAINLALIALVMVEIKIESHSNYSVSAGSSMNFVSLPEPELANLRLPSRDSFDVISNRPLLEPSRRPVVAEGLTQTEQEYVTLQLIGIYLSDADRIALVRLGTQEHAVWVRERDYISTWKVEKIEADRLQLRRMDKEQSVHLWSEPNARLF